MDSRQKSSISILMFPWLAHGHISPFLELAKKLTRRNFHIFFCSTTINLNSIKQKISTKYSKSIQLVELSLPPSFPNLPPHYHTTKGLPPHLMNTLKVAFDMVSTSPTFFKLLKTLNPDIVLYDFMQPWVPQVASSLNIPAVHFLITSVTSTSLVFHLEKKPIDEEFPFPVIYNDLQDCMKAKLMKLFENNSSGFKDRERITQSFQRSCCGIVLVKSFREIEGKYIDYLHSVLFKNKNINIVPVGPLVDCHQDSIDYIEDEKTKIIMEWLNKKERSSTVFVSFGSEYFLSEEEREEIAHGLELSNVNFIWVIRFHDGEKIKLEEALPKGFLQRVGGGDKGGGRGMVVEGWAPQTRILENSSIGGFVSHCGWSSVMESIKFGVPIIAMPMHLDQPINARLVEEVGFGLEVKRNKNGGLQREEVAKVIKEVLLEKSGEDVRKKVREMSDHISKKGEEEIDGALDVLVQLCGMRKNSMHPCLQ